jgi:hypothetical protein
MLLALLGVGGERTDIGAHFLGFVAGAAIGAALAVLDPRVPRGPRAQFVYGAAALALLALSWAVAMVG